MILFTSYNSIFLLQKRAIELFSNVKKSTKRKTCGEDESKLQKFSQYCNPSISHSKKPNSMAQAFSPSFALTEMRLCSMSHDWINLQRLFPLILELSNDKESLVWRYAFMIFLHSPMSSGVHLEAFLNSCVGCQTQNLNYVLEQLITLGTKEKT